MASHFVTALKISTMRSMRQRIHSDLNDDDDDDLDHFDVDINVEVEASETDAEAMREASNTEFDAGDVVGKVLAFVAQLRACSEDSRDYLRDLSASHGCPRWEIKLWVRTRWGSLSDCFHVVLAQRKVYIFYFDLGTI